MTQTIHSIVKTIVALPVFRMTGCVSKSLAASTLVLIFSIVTSVTYAQEEKATDTPVTLNAPAEASIGESITIDWVGPGQRGDVIAVAKVGAKKTINKTQTARGNPLTVQMPVEPGEYELRYIQQKFP